MIGFIIIRSHAMKSFIMWLLGVPVSLIILYNLFVH